MLFQGAALFDSLNIWENVAFGLIEGKKMKRSQAKELGAIDAYEKLGTDGVLRSKIIEMKRSGIEMTGFQKRLILGLCMKF